LESAIENAKSKAGKAITSLDHNIVGAKNALLSEFGMPYLQSVFRGNFAESKVMPLSTSVFSSEQDIPTSIQILFLIRSN